MKTTNNITYGLGCLFTVILLATAIQETAAQMKLDVYKSVQQNNYTALSNALLSGEDVNKQSNVGNTALMLAAKVGDSQIIDALLSYKADVNIRNNAGATALMIAAKYGHPHVIDKLLAHGADPTIKNNSGSTAAHFARGYKHQELHDYLVKAEKKFSLNKANKNKASIE